MPTNWVWMWAITETITMISRHMRWIDRKYKCWALFALYLLSHWFLGVFGWRPVCRQWSILELWAPCVQTEIVDGSVMIITTGCSLYSASSEKLELSCLIVFFFSFSNTVFEKSCSENKRPDQRRELAKTDDIQGRRIWCCTVHVL